MHGELLPTLLLQNRTPCLPRRGLVAGGRGRRVRSQAAPQCPGAIPPGRHTLPGTGERFARRKVITKTRHPRRCTWPVQGRTVPCPCARYRKPTPAPLLQGGCKASLRRCCRCRRQKARRAQQQRVIACVHVGVHLLFAQRCLSRKPYSSGQKAVGREWGICNERRCVGGFLITGNPGEGLCSWRWLDKLAI